MESFASMCFQAIPTILNMLILGIIGMWKKKQNERDEMEREKNEWRKNIEDAMRAILHDRIIQSSKHFIGLHYSPIDVRENVEEMYKAYVKLHGNGTAKRMFEELMNLPLEDPNQQAKRAIS